ncbi:DUF4105 domain-containing protein [Flavobacterium salilacus subsp. salilacus]|uniref:lipoprotein N-acyltransferase Lnb domain-containing protein n=1 Tax=Flavobacterium TaxID=237 RepID=UPI001074FD0A|nr:MULTISPECIES: DUF4105 domain-containing protein [Flavobacterium]KAF2519754.1 DUF4105 domain-containing protein [Flavobacterium salilacus subsp. salilacus]MBE1614353.1 DUF4105 domain-containing protein [Flavobacterium sp. SaA2.13]
MQRFITILLLLLSFFISSKTFAQLPLSEQAKITLLTCDPGEELYSVFGHTAIRIADTNTGMDVVYNFGSFDFSTPNFYLKFIKGDLQYFVSISSYNDFIAEYIYLERAVYEQELLLSTAQKQRIFSELNSILLSDRRFYTYKFIDRNCTTMVADIIAANIEGEISMETPDKGKTNREILYGYLDNHFYEKLGINLIFGYKTDKTADKLFLPLELKEGIENTSINGKPLAKPAVTIVESNGKIQESSVWNSFYSFAFVMIILMLFVKNKTVRLTYMIITGLLGIFFLTVGFYSFHNEITQNYNTLLINPLFLLLAFFSIANKAKAIQITAYACMALLLIYIIYMLNKPHIFIMIPIILLNGIVLLHVILKAKKQLLKTT